MSSEPAILIDDIGKRYRLGELQKYKALRDTLAAAFTAPFRAAGGLLRRGPREPHPPAGFFWALKNVSFQIAPGEVVGVIGRNGAGKSTLLKILSRITEPTVGYARIRGRVGSLLEVGTGFHPELSGRENIFLNGAILGMRREEIRRKFDDIVAFAEVGKFIDSPVKFYSSGMYVRLAFAVAAHLEPEILLVDEVLAVGDAAFQKKCLGKMGEVATQGRTVFLVSHNMAAIQSLCSRVVLFRGGMVKMIGRPDEAIVAHLADVPSDTESLRGRTDRQGDGTLRVSGITLYPLGAGPGAAVSAGDDVVLEVGYDNPGGQAIGSIEVTVGVYDMFGRAITFIENLPLHQDLIALKAGGSFRCEIPRLCFTPGEYLVNIHLKSNGRLLDWVQQAHRFTVHDGDFFATGKLTYSQLGGVFVPQSWRH